MCSMPKFLSKADGKKPAGGGLSPPPGHRLEPLLRHTSSGGFVLLMPYMGRLDQMTNVTGQDVVFELPLLVGHTVREALCAGGLTTRM